jgi:hypothetical protein
METSMPPTLALSALRRLLPWLALLALACAGSSALAQADPPARVGTLSYMEGSVAFAPVGGTEWSDAEPNRPITRGDRIWTDPGGRTEMHLGSAALHLDSQTFVAISALDSDVLQLSLNEGALNARVRQLEAGETFEIDTPQLAFRAAQAGDYRIDVDPAGGTTRVAVRSGSAMIYGAAGGTLQLNAGQQMAFSGRDLAPAALQPAYDSFDRWAADRNREEDQSISARYVPRDVVGYQQLDAYGAWMQDPSYGAVWYPRLTLADWAPYRYGRWEWIAPWGWTWIDDAPWGFATSHYGRWTQIGSRWCWVPGRIGPRPVYAPALVMFVSGRGAPALGAGPGIAWFPLAPGEAWRPTYRTSAGYLRNLNRNMTLVEPANAFFHQRRPEAITAVRTDDFDRGRPVHQHRSRIDPPELARVHIHGQPVMPQPRVAPAVPEGGPRVQPQPRREAAPLAPPRFGGPQSQLQPAPQREAQTQPVPQREPRFMGIPRQRPPPAQMGAVAGPVPRAATPAPAPAITAPAAIAPAVIGAPAAAPRAFTDRPGRGRELGSQGGHERSPARRGDDQDGRDRGRALRPVN